MPYFYLQNIGAMIKSVQYNLGSGPLQKADHFASGTTFVKRRQLRVWFIMFIRHNNYAIAFAGSALIN